MWHPAAAAAAAAATATATATTTAATISILWLPEFCLGLPRWASTRKVKSKPIWISWSKRQWAAVSFIVYFCNDLAVMAMTVLTAGSLLLVVKVCILCWQIVICGHVKQTQQPIMVFSMQLHRSQSVWLSVWCYQVVWLSTWRLLAARYITMLIIWQQLIICLEAHTSSSTDNVYLQV